MPVETLKKGTVGSFIILNCRTKTQSRVVTMVKQVSCKHYVVWQIEKKNKRRKIREEGREKGKNRFNSLTTEEVMFRSQKYHLILTDKRIKY